MSNNLCISFFFAIAISAVPLQAQVPCAAVTSLKGPELRTYIQKHVQLAHPCVTAAIHQLEQDNTPGTIDFLLSVLDYRRLETSAEALGNSTKAPTVENLYPALDVLMKFGEEATGALIAYLGRSSSVIGSQNARYALGVIHRDSLPALLDKLDLIAQKAPQADRERMEKAAAELAQFCSSSEMDKCKIHIRTPLVSPK